MKPEPYLDAIPWDNTGPFFVRPVLPEVVELAPIEALLAWTTAGGDPLILNSRITNGAQP